MTENKELLQAWEFVEHTGKSVFLTGKAGTGKTTFLRNVVKNSSKRLVVVAPTGVAAINAGGVTIHSFFQLPLSPFVPNAKIKNKFDFRKEKIKIIRTLDLLIIDEISMVRSDLLDAIDSVLRRIRRSSLPFGGVQLLMIGDLNQLTPVVTAEDEAMIKPYYDTPYFFGSHELQKIDYLTIELKTVYRQQDNTFVELLNNIRNGHPSQNDLDCLNKRYDPKFTPPEDAGYIRLTTHNSQADTVNRLELTRLKSEPHIFAARVEGTFPSYAFPTELELELRIGAQVMFVKNDPSQEHLYYNGKIGRVVYVDDDIVRVHCQGDEYDIDVTPQTWENAKYVLNEQTREIESDVQGTFVQMPLRLAWAITIHKSQGLTFEHAIIDASASFAPGQVYVALSRCKTLEGMVLATPLTSRAVINDRRVEAYVDQQGAEAQRSINRLPELKDEYEKSLLKELFDFSLIDAAEERMIRLLTEYFYNAFPKLLSKHKATYDVFKTKVKDVALRWNLLIERTPISTIRSEAFRERIVRSCEYFKDQLSEEFIVLLDNTKMVKSNNKEAMKRFDDVYENLRQSCLARFFLLRTMTDEPFSASSYLKAKQRCIMRAMDIGDDLETEKKKSKKKKTTEKKPKEKKTPTYEITWQLYKSGKSINEIAAERNLTRSTIYNHLARYIKQGELSIYDIMTKEKVSAIRQAMAKVGPNDGKTAIKALCPPEISYEEIALVTTLA